MKVMRILSYRCKYNTDLTYLNKNGAVYINSKNEHFEVILFLVADLSFIKEVIGKYSSNQTWLQSLQVANIRLGPHK